jgi:hypothetical protein
MVLLLLMAANHGYLRYVHDLSPWLGAGFGMFSTTDSVSARQAVVYGLDENGFGRELPVPDALSEQARRVLALPSPTMLRRLVEGIHRHRSEFLCTSVPDCVFSRYRIEIWRADYDPETLLSAGNRIADLSFTVPVND